MTKQEIFEIIEENFNILAAENNGTTKASQVRARKAPNTPNTCLLYTSPSPRDGLLSRMPSSA